MVQEMGQQFKRNDLVAGHEYIDAEFHILNPPLVGIQVKIPPTASTGEQLRVYCMMGHSSWHYVPPFRCVSSKSDSILTLDEQMSYGLGWKGIVFLNHDMQPS